MNYKALTSNNGHVTVPVEPFGLVGVQPQIIDIRGNPKLSAHFFVVVHLLTGHVVCQDLWTREEARSLARELADIRGWNSIPKDYQARYYGSRQHLQSAVGLGFIAEVKMVLSRHRYKKEEKQRSAERRF